MPALLSALRICNVSATSCIKHYFPFVLPTLTKRYRYYEDKEPLPYALRQLPPARQHGGMAKEVKIGMAIDDLRLERWQKDRDIFVNKAESLGAKVFVQSANGNEETQMSQIENMINRGVDVLVIIPYNGQYSVTLLKKPSRKVLKSWPMTV